MRVARDLPPGLSKGPFLVRDAISLGVTRGQLRARDLERPLWGARLPPALSRDFAATLSAASLVMSPDEVYSHHTAARILGLPLPNEWTHDEPVHVMGLSTEARMRRRGIVAHRGLERRTTSDRNGVVCTDAVTTWADLAALLDVDDVIVLGDAVVHWRGGIPQGELSAVIAARSGHRGVRTMQAALPYIRTRSDSPYETKARLLFIRAGLPEPELNRAVQDDAGEWLGTGDLVWKEQKVVAEFDGDYHRTKRRRWQLDVGKREAIQDHGWHYVQLTAEAITVPYKARRTVERLASLLGVTLKP